MHRLLKMLEKILNDILNNKEKYYKSRIAICKKKLYNHISKT